MSGHVLLNLLNEICDRFPPLSVIQEHEMQDSTYHMDRVKRIWYLSHMRAAKVQASLRMRAVSPEPPLLAHTSSESRGTFRQKTRSLAPLNGWTCAVEICHDGMLEDTNSLDGAHMTLKVDEKAMIAFNSRLSHQNVVIRKCDGFIDLNAELHETHQDKFYKYLNPPVDYSF